MSRISGSHHILTKEGARENICVPVHGTKKLGKGLESDILKKAGLK